MSVYLESKRLQLTTLRHDDLPALSRWKNDAKVRSGQMGWRMPVSEMDEERWLSTAMQGDGKRLVLAIRLKSSTVLIGYLQLFDIDWFSRIARLGISIGNREEWGKGYGTEAVQSLLEHAFEQLNLRKVTLEVVVGNERARSMYERLGFEAEGLLRQHYYTDGKYADVIIMSIFRPPLLEEPRG